MNRIIALLLQKLYFKQWSIGLCKGDIRTIIRNKAFNQDIHWLPLESFDHFQADPFLLRSPKGLINIFHEDFSFRDEYGKISLMSVDENFNIETHKILLDTKSHLSYPFIFSENGRIFVFPEASHSGKLCCYEFDETQQLLTFRSVVLEMPLLDPTFFKHNDKYWLFGTLQGKESHNKLYIFYSDNLFGPYKPHPMNPVKNSLNGSRSAGNIIEVDGSYYRPSQNCKIQYGESITINKITVLNENIFEELPYMIIKIDHNKPSNRNIFTIHTINVLDNIIAVDGSKWTFSPSAQWEVFKRNRRLRRLERKN